MRLQRLQGWAVIAWSNLVALSWSQELFDAREATISSVHNALHAGESCRNIVSAFLSRIEALDRKHVNSIISLDPNSLAIASQLDALFASKNTSSSIGPLFCVPVLLKDNFDTASLPTTGGSLALSDSRPSVDAPVVRALKDAGAVILGKTNLQELALEGISVSSLGGQTLNPYDASRTPGGSSGGSGAAVAASFAVLSMGTDTMNSLRSPASANSLFSLRPTRGLVSRTGVIPVSHTQDAVGPIARCVEDLAIALSVIANAQPDPEDNSTTLVPAGIRKANYYRDLRSGSLKGARFGIVETFFDSSLTNETAPVNMAINATMQSLQKAGATLISIRNPKYNVSSILASCDTQRWEFRQEMDRYLSRSSLGGRHPSSLKDIYNRNDQSFLVLPKQYEFIKAVLTSSTDDTEYEAVQNNIQELVTHLHATFATYNLDAIIYPQQKNLPVQIGAASQHGRNGILAAVSGFPSLAIPAGFSHATDTAPVGMPVGLEVLGLPWTEAKLLQIVYQAQALMQVRKPPAWATQTICVPTYNVVPSIEPDSNSVPAAYPLGVL